MKRAARLACAGALAAAAVLAAPAPALASNPANPYGLNAAAPSDAALDRIAASGAGWVRASFSWASIETRAGTYDWRAADRIVASANARNVEILAVVGGCPSWAASGAAGAPNNPADWSRFLTAIVGRYKGSVRHWVLWNEPNVPASFSGTSTDFINRVLKPGAYAVHTADPAASIIGPELSHDGQAWARWLTEVITQANGAIDVLSHHVYCNTEFETMRQLFGPKLPWESKSLLDVVEAAGPRTRLWLTATGVGSNVLGGEGTQASRDETLLAHLVIENHYWVNKVFLDLADGAQGPTGLCHADLGPKPAYGKVQGFIRAHAAAPSPWHPLEDFGGGAPQPDCVRFTNHLYQDFLGRPARLDEQQNVQELWNDVEWRIPVYFVGAPNEGYYDRIRAVFQAYLGRDAGMEELTTYCGQMNRSRGLMAIRGDVLGTDEYYRRAGGTPNGFVVSLYRDTLGRAPTAAELAAGLAMVAQNRRGGLAYSVLSGSERIGRLMNERLQKYLGRNVNADEIRYIKPLLQSGAQTEQAFDGVIVTTDEYRARASR